MKRVCVLFGVFALLLLGGCNTLTDSEKTAFADSVAMSERTLAEFTKATADGPTGKVIHWDLTQATPELLLIYLGDNAKAWRAFGVKFGVVDPSEIGK